VLSEQILLSEQTKQNIEQAFHRSLRTSLIRKPEDVCAIAPAPTPGLSAQPLPGAKPAPAGQRGPARQSSPAGEPGSVGQPGEILLVVTISSFVFRLLTLFQVGADPATHAYYVSAAQQSLDEAFREFANMCCGALNRELAEQIPHLAMSIPYTLSSQCLAFLGELRPSFLSTSAVTINDSVRLQVTLCMCCSAAVDFVASAAPVAETTAGELEMF
jgi:hypothetical protein